MFPKSVGAIILGVGDSSNLILVTCQGSKPSQLGKKRERRANIMRISLYSLGLVLAFVGLPGYAALPPEGGVVMMPLNCGELLPDNAPYINFFEGVARNAISSDKTLAKRILRILALRDKLAEYVDRSRGQNPVDTLIRKTICFYREQKEPLKPIAVDDPDFLNFMKKSLPDLETKVDDSIFQAEFERYRRVELERQAQRNQGAMNSLEEQANHDADRSFENISKAARRKVKTGP